MLALVSSRPLLSAQDLEPHRRLLWGMCYRMTGVAADADELVQETFVRALASPPADRSRELAPWLVRVAMNASRDLLRRRKRELYTGPWLPSPLEGTELTGESLSPGARYAQQESVSYAFLRALEALSATQRAVVILRDVLDYSVAETASVLDESEANVKTSHHRARAKLEAYEAEAVPMDEAALGQARAAMTRFFAHLALGDLSGLEQLFAEGAEGLNDGGGEFFAARVPIRTPRRLARFYAHVKDKAHILRAEPCQLSGLVGLMADIAPSAPGVALRSVNLFECDRAGRITRLYTLVATRKISHLWVTTS